MLGRFLLLKSFLLKAKPPGGACPVRGCVHHSSAKCALLAFVVLGWTAEPSSLRFCLVVDFMLIFMFSRLLKFTGFGDIFIKYSPVGTAPE